MKIVMVALFNERSTNNSQADGFENCGWTVIRYDYKVEERKLGPEKRDEDIIQLCYKVKPDAILFSKCNEIDISVVKECNTIVNTILWYMDPLNKNFCKSLVEKIRYCHYSFFALQKPFNEAKRYSDNVYFLPEGFDSKVDFPHDLPYKYDVGFIGGLRGERQRYFNMFKFNYFNNVYGSDHAKTVSQIKINLNFTEGGTSDRTYKVLAAKGFLLTQPWEDMENYFTVGKDLDVFNNEEELLVKINYYLHHDKEREQIAENGYHTVQKFNRTNWARNICEVINGTI